MDWLFFTSFAALMALHLVVTGCVVHIAWYLSRARFQIGLPWWFLLAGLVLVLGRKILIYYHVDYEVERIGLDEYVRVILLPGASTMLFFAGGLMIFLRLRRLARTGEGFKRCRGLAQEMFDETARIKKRSGAGGVHDAERKT